MSDEVKPTISQWERILLCEAVKSLMNAISSRSDEEAYRIAHYLEGAQKRIVEVFAKLGPGPKWTEVEAELSGRMHTFLRKCCDDTITTLLYRQIDRGLGMVAWHAFIATITQNQKPSIRDCVDAAHLAAELGGEDAHTTYLLLRGWWEQEGSIKEALKWCRASDSDMKQNQNPNVV